MVLGIDLSLNHTGFVILDRAGKMTWWDFVTDIKAAAQRAGKGVLLPKWNTKDPQTLGLRRLHWWRAFLHDLFERVNVGWVGIEDYAFAASSRAHATAELGGVARLAATDAGNYLRLHDPTSVKMFAALNGAATGHDVMVAVRDRWGISFDEANPPPPKKGKHAGKVNTLPAEDLAAAYTIARLVWTEMMLRVGKLKLHTLHEKEIQVFNRVTKANPVNLLGREWIELEA